MFVSINNYQCSLFLNHFKQVNLDFISVAGNGSNTKNDMNITFWFLFDGKIKFIQAILVKFCLNFTFDWTDRLETVIYFQLKTLD